MLAPNHRFRSSVSTDVFGSLLTELADGGAGADINWRAADAMLERIADVKVGLR